MTSVAEKEGGELQERKAVTELEAARPSLTVSEQTKGGSQGIPLPPPTPPHQQGFELSSSSISGAQASGHCGRAPNPASSRLCGRDEQSGFHSNRLWLSLGDLDSSPPPPPPNPTSILSGDLALLQSCHTIPFRLDSGSGSLSQRLWGPHLHIEPSYRKSIPGDKALGYVLPVTWGLPVRA